MFTETPATAFADNVDKIPAATANAWKRDIARAIDGTGGSAGTPYAPTTAIEIDGSGLKLHDPLAYQSVSVTRTFSFHVTTLSGNWSEYTTPLGSWRNTASGGTANIHLDGLPNGGTLTSITLRWQGAAGHGALPTMPSIQLYRINEDGTQTSLGSQADTSASVAAYEAVHVITLTGINHVIDRTQYRYVLQVTGETGGNFVANAIMWACKGAVTITAQPQGW